MLPLGLYCLKCRLPKAINRREEQATEVETGEVIFKRMNAHDSVLELNTDYAFYHQVLIQHLRKNLLLEVQRQTHMLIVCVCVCVCVREREREREFPLWFAMFCCMTLWSSVE